MTQIFKIIGGGQRVRQCLETKQPIIFIKEYSDLPEKAKCDGQDHFTGAMWSTNLDTLKKWANAWAGTRVNLVEQK